MSAGLRILSRVSFSLPQGIAHHALWSSGALRCVFIVDPGTKHCFVQVLDGASALYTEPCANADSAAEIGERLWELFVERDARR
jgi:hypothetical protein